MGVVLTAASEIECIHLLALCDVKGRRSLACMPTVYADVVVCILRVVFYFAKRFHPNILPVVFTARFCENYLDFVMS